MTTAAILGALGGNEVLPSPGALADAIGDAEIALLLGTGGVDDDLLALGWFLHSVASVPSSVGLYGINRQRAAFQVAGQILDMSQRGEHEAGLSSIEAVFGSQVAYLSSDLAPNAIAVYRRSIDRHRDLLSPLT